MKINEALEIARRNYEAHTRADTNAMFGRGPAFNAGELFGFHNGWYCVESYAFNMTDITGEPYDCKQGGFAYCD